MHMDAAAGSDTTFIAAPLSSPNPSDAGRGNTGLNHGEADDCSQLPAQLATVVAENHELRAEIERLRSERTRMVEIQNRMMEAIGCKSPDRLVHDVRNVLNERELYRALADTIQD
jgi:hypothetical protein